MNELEQLGTRLGIVLGVIHLPLWFEWIRGKDIEVEHD